ALPAPHSYTRTPLRMINHDKIPASGGDDVAPAGGDDVATTRRDDVAASGCDHISPAGGDHIAAPGVDQAIHPLHLLQLAAGQTQTARLGQRHDLTDPPFLVLLATAFPGNDRRAPLLGRSLDVRAPALFVVELVCALVVAPALAGSIAAGVQAQRLALAGKVHAIVADPDLAVAGEVEVLVVRPVAVPQVELFGLHVGVQAVAGNVLAAQYRGVSPDRHQ